MMSTPPPGVAGTMMRTARVGYCCANAVPAHSAIAPASRIRGLIPLIELSAITTSILATMVAQIGDGLQHPAQPRRRAAIRGQSAAPLRPAMETLPSQQSLALEQGAALACAVNDYAELSFLLPPCSWPN